MAFQILAYIMQQSQKTTKKWADYSEDSEEQPDSDHEIPLRNTVSGPARFSAQNYQPSTKPNVDHRSPEFIQQQISKFDEIKERCRDIWLIVQSTNQNLLDKKIKNFKEDQESGVIYTFNNRAVKGAWDLKVKQEVVELWLKNGMDQDRVIKITLSEKNFKPKNQGYDDKNRTGGRGGFKNNSYGDSGGRGERRDRGDRGDRGERRDRGDRGDRGGRGERRGGRGRRREGQQGGHQFTQQQRQERRNNRNNRTDQPRQKKVYVDKVTGKVASNKEEIQKKVIEEKERHYTKEQAQKVGLQLGNFRNKPKTVQEKPQVVEPKYVYEPVRKEREKQEVKAWGRKQKVVQQKGDFKKLQYREKNSTRQQQTAHEQKPKKKYVTKKVEGQQVKQQKKKEKDTNGLLSEDSN